MARIVQSYLLQARRLVVVHRTRVGVTGFLQPTETIVVPEDFFHRFCGLGLVNRGLRRCCTKIVKRKIAHDCLKLSLNTYGRYDRFKEPTARPQYVVEEKLVGGTANHDKSRPETQTRMPRLSFPEHRRFGTEGGTPSRRLAAAHGQNALRRGT